MNGKERPRQVNVALGERSYPVLVEAGLLERAGEVLQDICRSNRAVIVTDSRVGPLYADTARESLQEAGYQTDVLEFAAGEAGKNLATYAELMHRLLSLDPPIDRRSVLVTLGGGVVSDLGGFMAATALRGIALVNLPTTLLAAVDASVGGKNGVDTPAGKNLVGTFYQPKAVLIDASCLATLPAAEMANGLGECVKHAVIRDEGLLGFIESHAGAILSGDQETLVELIAANVAIKAAVVSADERESSERAHLNLGHTLGHAIETAGGYGAIGHGQAVALGMRGACRIAVLRGRMAASQERRVVDGLAKLHLPTRFADVPGLPPAARDLAALRRIMLRDKKVRLGRLRFVLPVGLGSAEMVDDVTDDQLAAALAALKE